MKKTYVKFRHHFFFAALRPVGHILAWKSNFKAKPIKLEKGQNYLILFNHQSFLDSVYISLTIRGPIYSLMSDAYFSQKWYSRLLFYCLAPIKKRKGYADLACIRTMCKIAKEGGTVALAPEGTRQWNDSVFYIDKAIVKLVRLLKLPLLLYNLRGGYGVKPRWSKERRKGKLTGGVREIIPWEEICAMSDDELHQRIVLGLKVIDSESGELYKSDSRAEYLERELFVCPKCGAASTLYSHGNDVRCERCGLTVTYGENLHLTSADPDFKFDKLVDWYEFQQKYVREYDLDSADVICFDNNVRLYDKTEKERVLVGTGRMVLKKDVLSVGNWQVSTSEIYGGCAQDGDKMSFNVGDRSYLAVGHTRFNCIKYLLFFNRVCELIAQKGGDKHYGLYLDPALR